MSKIIVLGAGIIGLATALLLEKQGHDVTVLERDDTPLPQSPKDAWEAWERRGVAQFRQAHYLHCAGRQLIEQHLPEVREALVDAGCVSFNLLRLMPPTITDRSPRPGDDRYVTLTGRRTTLEYGVAKAAEKRVTIERGVSTAGLESRQSGIEGVPHVTGVRTKDGRQLSADLVIDATGRGSKLADWLQAIGAQRPIEDAEESGFFYYTRFFRAATAGKTPAFRAGLITHFHSFSVLTLPGDADTWSVTVFFFVGDAALKALRDPARWTALIAACPGLAHWLEGEPISDVLPMGGVSNRFRKFVVNGAPVATGVLAVGDAAACTNPIGGRGMTTGLMHAVGTADVVRKHLDDPFALALAHDAMIEARITPWYRNTVEFDRLRAAQITASIHGRPEPQPVGPGQALPIAMLHDATLFRAQLEMVSMLALPREVLGRPGIVDRIMALADIHPPIQPAGPSRAELLQLVS